MRGAVYDVCIQLLLPPIQDRASHLQHVNTLAGVLSNTNAAHVTRRDERGIDFVFKYTTGALVWTSIVDTLTTGAPLFTPGRHPKPLACYLWLLLQNAQAGNFRYQTGLALQSPFNDRPLTNSHHEVDVRYVTQVYRSLHGTPANMLLRSLPAIAPQLEVDRRQIALI